MFTGQLEERFLSTLGGAESEDHLRSIRYAVDFARLIAGIVPHHRVTENDRTAMRSAISVRCQLSDSEIDLLLDMAMAPERRGTVNEDELRAFGVRFGSEEEQALRHSVDDEMDLQTFTERYGTAESLLLLDSLFAVCAVDGIIDRTEIERLQQHANELGVDPVLVGALFRKHDVRHAAGDFTFALEGQELAIGRSGNADVQLPDPHVAPRHARLVKGPDGWRLVDAGSGRPTMVNGAQIQSAIVGPDDNIRVGPYTLTIDREFKTVTAFGHNSFSALSIRHLTRKVGSVSLLDDVNFTVFSGEVVAIVGPSGAGKTTLLNAITGVAPADSGDVLLDSAPFHALLASDRSLVGSVPQDDVVHAELTVEESLWYSARLRFPADVANATLDSEVDRVLRDLGIDHIRDSRIGNAVRRGISGGQRKRVNLGSELLTRSTRILFLDEPTSGLDPHTSEEIVSLLRQLADHGRIVFIVTHDVNPSVLRMVDHLMVLAPGGRLAWFGPPVDADEWFEVDSPDEIFAAMAAQPTRDWGKDYREGDAFRKFVRTREHLLGLDNAEPHEPAKKVSVTRSRVRQYLTLTRRYFRVKFRDRAGTLVLLSQAPILGLAMWIVFPHADTGAIFMLSLSALWFGASAAIRELIAERTIWRREARVGVGVLPYMASKVTVLALIVAIQCITLAAMNYGLLGMGGVGPGTDPEHPLGFDPFLLGGFAVLTGWVGMSLGLMLSSMFRSSEAAVSTLPIVIIPQITFGGLLVKIKKMSLIAKGLTYLIITRYSFDALLKSGTELWVPSTGFQAKEPLRLLGVLSDLGLRGKDATVDDMGMTHPELAAALVLFILLFLTVATVLTSRHPDES